MRFSLSLSLSLSFFFFFCGGRDVWLLPHDAVVSALRWRARRPVRRMAPECHCCDNLGFAWRCPVFTPLGRMPSPSGGVVVGRRSEDLLEPTLLLTHQEGAAVARLLRVVAAAAAAPNAGLRKLFVLCFAVPSCYACFALRGRRSNSASLRVGGGV